jgi:acyl-CoA reductase-like NAD-dependent aldehyde dehydrogenase
VESAQRAWQGALFSGGEFTRPVAGGTIGVRDKASGEIFATAGLATGAAGCRGRADRPGQARLVDHPDVAMIHFTRSTAVGPSSMAPLTRSSGLNGAIDTLEEIFVAGRKRANEEIPPAMRSPRSAGSASPVSAAGRVATPTSRSTPSGAG